MLKFFILANQVMCLVNIWKKTKNGFGPIYGRTFGISENWWWRGKRKQKLKIWTDFKIGNFRIMKLQIFEVKTCVTGTIKFCEQNLSAILGF